MGSFFDWVIGKSVAFYNGRIASALNIMSGMEVAVLANASTITFTAGQILGGMVRYDPTGGSATATLPTAALLVAELGDAAHVGLSFDIEFIHTGSTSEVVTLAAGTGNTLSPTTQAYDGAEVLRVRARLDNVTAGSEAVTYYSLGLNLLST